MKKIFSLALIFLAVFLIYLENVDDKLYFLSLSDRNGYEETSFNGKIEDYLTNKGILEKHISSFSEQNLRTTDLIQKIEKNESVFLDGKKQTIKNALIKADLIILSIGSNDLFDRLLVEENRKDNYHYINSYLEDVEDLFEILRSYCKEDIFFLEIYNPQGRIESEYINYINEQIKKLCEKEDIVLIEYQKELTNDMFNDNFFNEQAQEVIYNKLLKQMQKTLLK